MTRVTLVRHGAVQGPPALYGRTDVALSTGGRESLRHTLLACDTPTHIISSPLIRCAETAGELADTLRVPLRLDKNLQEMDFGLWDGVAFTKDDPDWSRKEKFWANPARHTPPDGESLANMAARVCAGWHNCLTLQTQHPVIVTHGGVIRLIVANLFALDWRTAALYSSLGVAYASALQITLHQHHRPTIQSAKGISLKQPVPTELIALDNLLRHYQNS